VILPLPLRPDVIVVAVALVALALGWHAWLARSLSVVLSRFERASWRAWVPVLNEAEILRCGGLTGWWAAASLVPVAGLLALVPKARAVRRINGLYGLGIRYLVLGLLLPPVWASELERDGRPGSSGYERLLAGGAKQRPFA
jgi:hypothetical protein